MPQGSTLARHDQKVIRDLLDDLAKYSLDPLGFVKWAFPWGTGTLLNEEGPEVWQSEVLRSIGEQLRAGGDAGCLILEQITAGHGTGKSCLISWLILWAVMTREDTRGVVTANTDTQLRTKTWAELSKWFNLCVARTLFLLTATSIRPITEKNAKDWRIDQIPWSKDNTEAFAGLHNKGKRILVLFDEGSSIDEGVYEVTEGALTDADTQILWLCSGNPTRTSGHFYEVLTGQRVRWHNTKVDSRDVRFSNKKLIQDWADEYGEDSDFFRVRVKGEPPRAGITNFIAHTVVDLARRREVPVREYSWMSKIISCDQARFGDDKTIVSLRQGAKLHKQIKFSGMDNKEVADRIIDLWRQHPDTMAVVVEVAGLAGTGLIDILKRIPNLPLMVAVPAQLCDDESEFLNMRARMWGMAKNWIETAEIPDDKELCEQLADIQFGYSNRMKIQMESKKDVKKRRTSMMGSTWGSPDCADSLILSFWPEIFQRQRSKSIVKVPHVQRKKVIWQHNKL